MGTWEHVNSTVPAAKKNYSDASAKESVDAAFLQPQVLKEHLLVFVAVQLGDVLLGLGRNDHRLGAFLLGYLLNAARHAFAETKMMKGKLERS